MSAPSSPAGVESPGHRTARLRMGGGLLAMGILHVVVPKPFEAIIPKALGRPRFWNLLAAAAEATAGILLLQGNPKGQRAGGVLATATIVGVYPANINMAIEAGPPTNPKAIATWLRLPLQFPMIRMAARLARGEG